jgi:hypothetical protein
VKRDPSALVIKRWKTKWTAKKKVNGVFLTYSVSTDICHSLEEFLGYIKARKPFDEN